MKPTLKNYLSVSKKEWNGMVLLVMLLLLILAAPYVYQLFRKDSTINAKAFDAAVAMLDKAKISQAGDQSPHTGEQHSGPPVFYKKAAAGTIIELNSADSAKLTELRGIGGSLARRIISYRNRLGGFYNKEQLREVFGLDSATYTGLQAQVSTDAGKVRKMHINKVSFDALRNFPYLSYKQTNAIIQFREQHGDYLSLDDMKNIAIMNDGILRKIAPYIDFK